MKKIAFLIMFSIIVSYISPIEANAFHEGWETSQIGTYIPTDSETVEDHLIPADEGFWFLGDTVSEFSECGPTPQKAEIITQGGSQVLRLTSNNSNSGCADNVWVQLIDTSLVGPLTINQGFSIPISNDTMISFKESGLLNNFLKSYSIPHISKWGSNCVDPPCFNNASLLLEDFNGNIIAYVMQRDPSAVANETTLYGDIYREIFLDTNGGTFFRNLYDDFSLIPNFIPGGARIRSITFEISEHGWAIIDDISIGINIASPVISLPTARQSYPYAPVAFPISNINPSNAKPIGIGSVATGGETLSVQISLEQFEGLVDIYGAFIMWTDPQTVNVLNPDGFSFSLFTVNEINNALLAGAPPSGAYPWKSKTNGPIDEILFTMPISSLLPGRYTAYLLVTQAGELNNYYLWETTFVIP